MFTKAYLLLIALIWGSCTFTPENKYVSPILPPEPISFSIEVNDPNFQSPYYLITSTQFNFTLKDLSKPVIDYEVVMDGSTILGSGAGDTKTVSFHMFPHAYSDGTHNVVIRIRVATKSGSLAERLGAEYYLVENPFQIIIDRTHPVLTAPPTASFESGFLTVRWGAPTQKNFRYIIKRTYQPYNPLWDSVISNTAVNRFVDRGYTGGDITYKITASGYGFEQLELGSVRLNTNPVDYSLEMDQERVVRLKWTNSLINTDQTTVKVFINATELKTPLMPSGDIVLDTLVMGEERTFWIDTYRDYLPYQMHRQILNARTEKNIKEYTGFAMLPDHQKLLLISMKAIYCYSLPDLTLEDSVHIGDMGKQKFSSLAVSDDETRAAFVADGSEVWGLDPLDFGSVAQHAGVFNATVSATGGNGEIQNIVLGNLSNTGLLTMVIAKSGRVGVVYDVNANLVRWSSSKFIYLNPVRPPVVSNDGLYVVYDLPSTSVGEVFERSGETFTQIATVENGLKYFRSNSNELVSATSFEEYTSPSQGNILVYDLGLKPAQPDDYLTKLREHTVPLKRGNEYLTEIKYDPVTESLYTRHMEEAFSTIRLLDIDGFQETGQVKAMSYTIFSHAYSSHYHFTGRGYIDPAQ